MNDKPEVRAAGGIYLLEWKDRHLGIRVDRLYEDSHYNVTGEVRIESTAPGINGHLHQARLNLTSTSARKTLAKALDEIETMPGVEWGKIVEELCVTVLHLHRLGEPPTRLDAVQPRVALKYQVEPLILANQPNLWFGDGGSTKSLLAAYVGLLVQEGRSQNGLVTEPGKVLYLDWEDSVYELKDRVTALRRGLNLETNTDALMYRRCAHGLATDLETIHHIVMDNHITMVIVDSAAYACGGDPLKAEFPIAYFNALRALDVTSLTIAHQPKELRDNKMPFGSVFWFNGPRNIYQLRKTEDMDTDVVQTGFFHVKTNVGKKRSPVGYEITFDNTAENNLHSVSVHRTDIKKVPDLAKGLPLKQQIIGVLSGGSMEVEEIASAIAANKDSVQTVLYRHKNDFAKQPNGAWGLPFDEALPF